MLSKSEMIPERPATLHCIWVPLHAGADAPLIAHWIDTTRCGSARHENPRRSSGERGINRGLGISEALQTLNDRERERGFNVQTLRDPWELVDPRHYDGGRLSYGGMPLLPVSLECEWMSSDTALQRAIVREMFVIGSETPAELPASSSFHLDGWPTQAPLLA
jgi:hypothetical protein